MTFEQHLAELAAHPSDRGHAAVFADWLLERGDVRGEALVLELAGEHRKLQALLGAHQPRWLEAWLPHLDLERCAFFGPFPTRLTFKRGAPGEALRGLPPTVRHLGADWRALPALAAEPLKLETLEVTVGLGMAFSDFRALADELDAVAPLKSSTLHLQLDTFTGVEAANFLAEAFLRSALCERERVALLVRDGSLDAACIWLHRCSEWGGGDRWGARWGGVLLEASRDHHHLFRHLVADLTFDDEKPLAARAASAAAMLSQLGRLTPSHIDVHLAQGVRAGKKVRDILEAARRFLPHRPRVQLVRKK